jgi:hypothetical protein
LNINEETLVTIKEEGIEMSKNNWMKILFAALLLVCFGQ